MNFLLDTNVVSEPLKPQPDSNVLGWLGAADEDRLFISVVTLAELRTGIERMPTGARRKRLEEWLDNDLPLRFDGRILPIDSGVANACGKTVARCLDLGRPIQVMDAFIAATAEIHDLTLVTRDVTAFQPTLKSVLNPWVT